MYLVWVDGKEEGGGWCDENCCCTQIRSGWLDVEFWD